MDKFNLKAFISDFKNGIDNPHNIGWVVPCDYTAEDIYDNLRLETHTDYNLTRMALFSDNKLIWCGIINTEVFTVSFDCNDRYTFKKYCKNQLKKYEEYTKSHTNWLHVELLHDNMFWHWERETSNNVYEYSVQLIKDGFDVEVNATVTWGERLYKKTNFTADINTTQQRRTKEWFKDLIEYTLDQQETQFLL